MDLQARELSKKTYSKHFLRRNRLDMIDNELWPVKSYRLRCRVCLAREIEREVIVKSQMPEVRGGFVCGLLWTITRSKDCCVKINEDFSSEEEAS
jgi:hypothetical protein